jgi:DNA topoisomerase-1
MATSLIIVESPFKAKTIQKYVGHNYVVESCYGHIRDLPSNKKGIDIEANFQPSYEISKDKMPIVKKLQKLVKTAKKVYLASDDDREGEAIAWHLKEALNITEDKLNRIVFKEITKKAILHSLEHPRGIDTGLVNSQQARRILDRIVGYDISPILWKKMKPGLSAGRVQSVAVKMIVEREREAHNFVSTSSFKVVANFFTGEETDTNIKAQLAKKLSDYQTCYDFLKSCQDSKFTILSIENTPHKKSPNPPYTTSTLQQEANYTLGYSVSKTMLLAQRLYEEGKISYMRTDSVRISKDAIENAKSQINRLYGDTFFCERHYASKSSNVQDAHEAIRPTDFSQRIVSDDQSEQKLYEMIWKRALASQMADAQIERTTVKIGISNNTENHLIAKGEVIKFAGFMKVYGNTESANILPAMNIGQQLLLEKMVGKQVFTKPPSQFTEASLVKHLEEQGIGRPSTYAPTISTIQNRGYVIKDSRPGKEVDCIELKLENNLISKNSVKEIVGNEKNKLFPTNIALLVNDFLAEHFDDITDYEFTAKLEESLDNIAYKAEPWTSVLKKFYTNFEPKVLAINAEQKKYINKVRELGIDPQTNKPVIARMGRFGPLVQIGDENDIEKPKFSSLKKGQLIETITLEEALELFKLPRIVGELDKEVIKANIGRFGPYLLHKGAFYSLGKNYDPLLITQSEAIKFILDKKEAEQKKIIKSFEESDIIVAQGRWGAYIKHQNGNVKLPKDIDPSNLTLEKCQEIIAASKPSQSKNKKAKTRKSTK